MEGLCLFFAGKFHQHRKGDSLSQKGGKSPGRNVDAASGEEYAFSRNSSAPQKVKTH